MGLAARAARIPAPRPVVGMRGRPVRGGDRLRRAAGHPARGARRPPRRRRVTEIWQLVGDAPRRRVAHRSLGPNDVMIEERGPGGLAGSAAGTSRPTTSACGSTSPSCSRRSRSSVGPERTVTRRVAELGEDAVRAGRAAAAAGGAERPTRGARSRSPRTCLATLRDEVVALRPSRSGRARRAAPHLAARRRHARRWVAVAGYIVLTQFAQVNFARRHRDRRMAVGDRRGRVLGPHLRGSLDRPAGAVQHPPPLRRAPT